MIIAQELFLIFNNYFNIKKAAFIIILSSFAVLNNTTPMKKNVLIIVFLIMQFGVIFAQNQIEKDGVIVPKSMEFNNEKLVLNGYGTRSKAWLDLYVQALYLTVPSQDPQEILDSETEMAIRIEIISKLVSSKKLTKALENGFEKSCGDNLAIMQPKIDLFKNMLTDAIVDNDVFVLLYNPSEIAIEVYKNNLLKGKIPGSDFKKALFGIWLSDNPADDDLKNELLGLIK
jgi:hypothetical protein